MTEDVAARVTAARGVLQAARDNLDEAVAGLPYGDIDNAMASPELLAMLVRVVDARRRLLGLEHQLARTGVA